MARHARLVLPNVAMHIVQRGNNRGECFKTDADRLVYLSILRELSALTSCAIHAYCLMSNHVHLLLTPASETGPGRMLRDLGRCYASYFNRRNRRTGTLWEGRFRSCLVESPLYVLSCYRYIEMNPVRAGMVQSPEAYVWSSHRANLRRSTDALVSRHPEFSALASGAYSQLFMTGDDPHFAKTIREATVGGYPLVGNALQSELKLRGARTEAAKPGPRPTTIVSEPCREITYLTPN